MATRNVATEIAELWASGTPIVYVVTPEEDRAVALCESAAEAFDARAGVWSAHRGLAPFAPQAKDPIAMLDAVLAAPAPVIAVALDFHQALESHAVARKLRDVLPRFAAQGRCLAIVAPRLVLPEGLVADTAVIRLPLPDEAELASLLDAVRAGLAEPRTPALGADVRHRALVAARGLTEAQARRAFSRALRGDAALGPEAIGAIVAEKERLLARDLGLELVESVEGTDVIGGLEGFKAWMEERALAFDPDARRWGLPPPRGVLLVGVQGCGKSLTAKAAAARLGVPVLRLDLPRVMGSGPGAEESLHRALEAAEALAPVALWVDEIEKGFAGSAPGDGGDPRAARLLGAFSTWLQERQGAVFVVATANDVSRLPPELLRRGRFDELFFVDLPDLGARREILSLHLRRRSRDPEQLDVASIAGITADYSGAELEQVVIGALHRAYAQGRELETGDLRRIAQDLVPLFKTYEEQIKALREWARGRARVAGRAGEVVELFRRAPEA
jgi:AAA+ superfamily predicted ATPase